MKQSREWFLDDYGTWIYWQPHEQIFGTIQVDRYGTHRWEARIDHRYRETDQSIIGKAPTLEAAKKIIKTILLETRTIQEDPWEEHPFDARKCL